MGKLKLNIKGLVVAFIGALVANLLHFPLPWLLGPLLAVNLCGAIGVQVQCNELWRKCGQVIIGMTLGLYFTPTLVNAIGDYLIFVCIGVLWAVSLNIILAILQRRFNHVDWATAWFASSIGSASEMVNVAIKHNAKIDKVVAAHTLRITLLVISLPLLLGMIFPIDPTQVLKSVNPSFDVLTLLLLGFMAIASALFFQKIKLLNSWLLGPLIVIGIWSYWGLLTEKMPNLLIYLGQLCIGWSLGSKFPYDFFQVNKKFIFNTLLFNSLAVFLTLCLCFGLGFFLKIDIQILLLGLSPGGIAEMSLTAKALGVAVPIVVAFQVTRLIFVILTSSLIFRLSHYTIQKYKNYKE
ncbi:AbrB family transcriptional regulator [Acinetobacter sp. ANC 3813]|uniref:AbrB family transcriptional regulator n=1 Tax=Acinetobacter sp. ANC 3813 TaxID=1977873 RepID=UPI000A3507BE|nr:AbrB family transcriptional regulator [Acinetobacter sp. ANC 3813]OTG89197.1 aminopeptidase [Acinetobacter sp. ANC 3813]